MNRASGRMQLAAIVLVALAGQATARAQSYGVGSQVLTIGVSKFQGINGATQNVSDDGYLYNPVAGAYSYYLAPLALPEGALVESLCAYVNDSDPGDFQYVQTYLVQQKLATAGQTPAMVNVPGASVSSTSDIGYGYYCSEPFTYTLRGTADVDGDGTPDAVVPYLAIYVPAPVLNSLGFGGVRISWKRQVSPAPAAPTFGDVPASDPAFPFIEALAASGITAGCAGGNYCPDASLTRRQMAVFLAKALGLHWAD